MSEQIKYEPVFGLQKPFDGGPVDAEFYSLDDEGCYYFYKTENTIVKWWTTEWVDLDGCPSYPINAMRRIIKTPVWTKADQEAGRLPEVGCKVISIKSGDDHYVLLKTTAVIVTFNQYLQTAYTVSVSEFAEHFRPIETPEERAEREREEWCCEALDYAKITDAMKSYELKRIGEYIGYIYDALLAGELKMPEVQK